MPPREKPHACAKVVIISGLKFAPWPGGEKDVFEGDTAVLGIHLGDTPPEGARDDEPARLLRLLIAPEEAMEVLVMPHFVHCDQAGVPLQHRFFGHIGQRAVKCGGAGLHDTARRQLQPSGSGERFERAATGVFREEATIGGVPVKLRPGGLDIAF